MWRDKIERLSSKNTNFVMAHGAIGDMISSLPAVVFARMTHSMDFHMNVWVAPYQVDLVKHLISMPGLSIRPLNECNPESDDESIAGTGSKNGLDVPIITRNRFDLVDYAFAVLLDTQCEADWQRNYPHQAPIGSRTIEDDYIVIPTGATNFPSVVQAELLEHLIEYIVGFGIKPVLVGKSSTDVVMLDNDKPHKLTITDKTEELPEEIYSLCIDMRDKTTLLELRNICGHAKAVIGIDGGTLHLAGTTDVPIVYGCTRVDPKHRSIVRHNVKNWKLRHVVPHNLECAGCQSHWNLLYHHNFATCIYGDSQCTKNLEAEDFVKALKELEVIC